MKSGCAEMVWGGYGQEGSKIAMLYDSSKERKRMWGQAKFLAASNRDQLANLSKKVIY